MLERVTGYQASTSNHFFNLCAEDKVLPCNCGCSLEENKGQILSQLPSKETKSCEWRILAPKGTTISLNVTRLILKAGWVRIASGKKTLLTLLKPGPEPPYPWKYKSEGNLMTLELLSYPDASGNVDSNTYLAAKYKHIRGMIVACLLNAITVSARLP